MLASPARLNEKYKYGPSTIGTGGFEIQGQGHQDHVSGLLGQSYFKVVDWLAEYCLIEDQTRSIIGYAKPSRGNAVQGQPRAAGTMSLPLPAGGNVDEELFRVYTSPYRQPRHEVLRAYMDRRDPWRVVRIADPISGRPMGEFVKETKALRSIFTDHRWRIAAQGRGVIGHVHPVNDFHVVDLYGQLCGQFRGTGSKTYDGWWQIDDPRYDRRYLMAAQVISTFFDRAWRMAQASSGSHYTG